MTRFSAPLRRPRRRIVLTLIAAVGIVGAAAGYAASTGTKPYAAAAVADINPRQGAACAQYQPRTAYDLDVCLTGSGSSVTPSVNVRQVDPNDNCELVLEIWDDAGNRLDSQNPASQYPCRAGQFFGASEDLNALSNVTAHTSPDGTLTVHAFAHLTINGTSVHLAAQGDSPTVSVLTGAEPAARAAESLQPTPVPVPTPVATKAPTFACQVDIRANYALGAPPVRHLYVIYTDAIGRQTVFRGGPTSQNPTKFGPIKAVAAPYTGPGSPDWSASGTDPTVAVASGGSACGSDICLAGEVDRINNMSIPYVAAGPNVKNSNSVAYTVVSNCGMTAQLPPTVKPVYVPGWNVLL